jgi:uncharacterized glyoxalase superfamily protein PhnB
MPPCAIIPELVYEDVGEAIDWLCEVFGFRLRWRAGDHRAQLMYGGGAIVLTEQRIGQGWSDQPDATALRIPRDGEVVSSVMVRVQDAQAHYQRARDRGARILHPPTDYPYGERQYSAADLAGHRWNFSESIADVSPEEWGGTSAEPG